MAAEDSTDGKGAGLHRSAELLAALNPKRRAFVLEFIRCKNATDAYHSVYGGKRTSADTRGPLLAKTPGVSAAIAHMEAEQILAVQEATGITLERTVKELARIAFFDPRKMFDDDGRPRAINELDDETAAVVAGLDVLEEWDGIGEAKVLRGYVKKWKLSEKKGALDMLMKHLGGYKEDNDQQAKAAAAAAAAAVEPGNALARKIAWALHKGMQAAQQTKKG